MNRKIFLSLCLFVFSLLPCFSASAQTEKSDIPLLGELYIDQQVMREDKSALAILTLTNQSSDEIKNVNVVFPSPLIEHEVLEDMPLTIPPHSSAKGIYNIKPNDIGIHRIILLVEYVYVNSYMGELEHTQAFYNALEVTDQPTIDWPDYIIPFLLGFLTSVFTTWLVEWRERKLQISNNYSQALGLTLALLRSAKASIQHKEEIKFELWHDIILRENLFLFFDKFQKEINVSDFSNRLSELPIKISDYNHRYKNQLPYADLAKEIDDMIDKIIVPIVENNDIWNNLKL